MAEKIVGPSSLGESTHNEVTTTVSGNKAGLDVRAIQSDDINLYDIASNTLIYTGSAQRGSLTSEAAWSVSEIDLTTTTISIKKSLPNQVWDNRASLTYE